MTHSQMAVVFAAIWMVGALAMLLRLISRIRRERREAQSLAAAITESSAISGFVADGIPVSFGRGHAVPAVSGVLYPHISLPIGIERLLSHRELNAVLLHEVVHARRRDNLIRLLYEVSLCVVWFHPLIWFAGTRMALYRELSCDESVIQRAYGQELISALAKLARPEPALFLQATASSHLGHRLARLAEGPKMASRASSLLLTYLFAVILVTSTFETVAHTACCFALKH
jgi:beta-lactamase regulating signal transducer with metallopeptidase domain